MNIPGSILVGQVWEWASRARTIVTHYSAVAGLWYMDNVDVPGQSMGYDETDILHQAVLTTVQPEQIWTSDLTGQQYRITRPLPFCEWETRRDDGQFSYFPEWIILKELTLVDLREKVRPPDWGPHVCPSCNSDGAQILFNMIDCRDTKCRHYRKK